MTHFAKAKSWNTELTPRQTEAEEERSMLSASLQRPLLLHSGFVFNCFPLLLDYSCPCNYLFPSNPINWHIPCISMVNCILCLWHETYLVFFLNKWAIEHCCYWITYKCSLLPALLPAIIPVITVMVIYRPVLTVICQIAGLLISQIYKKVHSFDLTFWSKLDMNTQFRHVRGDIFQSKSKSDRSRHQNKCTEGNFKDSANIVIAQHFHLHISYWMVLT